MMLHLETRQKAWVIFILIAGILCLYYLTPLIEGYRHAFYRALVYIPLLVGAFWFGVKGALVIAGVVIFLFLPYAYLNWDGFSLEDFHQVLEAVMYMVFALTAGVLVERERKKNRALLEAESLAAVGRAVADVAHDMKAPLMAIGGFANQVSKALDPEDPKQKKLHIVTQETARLESMVREMLDFGRPMAPHCVDTDVNALVQETLQAMTPTAESLRVDVKAELDPSLPTLSLDTHKFKQVLINLTTNALEASPQGERVLIETTHGMGWANLSVIDRGSGIDPEDQAKVFQPFFSKKKGGTGLGLPIVKRIVEAHGGEISLRANAQRGVTFEVRFPYGKNVSA